MPSLSSGLNLGSGSVSSLVRSANTLQNQIATYNDSLQASTYAASAKDDGSYASYKQYLEGRIKVLQGTGSVSDAEKSLSLSNLLRTATNSNISTTILRENIQVMAGNATLTDKYNVVREEFSRAVSIGDMGTAQSLESQAYSISQQIQYQAQQAAAASVSLAKASSSAAVSYQGEVVTSLDNGLKELNNAAKNMSEKDFNKYSQDWVKSNSGTFSALGVVLPKGAQPNYWDIVQGVTGAKYTALILQAQAEAPIDTQRATNYATSAQLINEGATQIDTLGGKLTLQELQQAAQDPNMFAYNNTTGKYDKTQVEGYQYITTTASNGKQSKTLAPLYSGIVSGTAASQFYYLTAKETSQLGKLGFNITAKVNPNGTVGSGITVQATGKSPAWLKSIFGNNGEAQFYNQDGNLTFKSGNSFYTLGEDSKGLSGLLQHMPDGTVRGVGGDYGFNAGAVENLINQSQQTIANAKTTADKQQAALNAAKPVVVPKIPLARVAPPTIPHAGQGALPRTAPVFHAPTVTAPAHQATPQPLGTGAAANPNIQVKGTGAAAHSAPGFGLQPGGGFKL